MPSPFHICVRFPKGAFYFTMRKRSIALFKTLMVFMNRFSIKHVLFFPREIKQWDNSAAKSTTNIGWENELSANTLYYIIIILLYVSFIKMNECKTKNMILVLILNRMLSYYKSSTEIIIGRWPYRKQLQVRYMFVQIVFLHIMYKVSLWQGTYLLPYNYKHL